MVSGGGMMNGNAYATIELKDGIYYYCEYGKNESRKSVGNTIMWGSQKIPSGCDCPLTKHFNIIDRNKDIACSLH